MKIIFLFIVSCILAVILILLFDIKTAISENIISTIYNAICIFFAIGMGLIVSFSLTGVKNINFIKNVRHNIKKIRLKFILLFIFCTFLYIVNNTHIFGFNFNSINILCLIQIEKIISFLSILITIFFIMSIAYLIYNFISIQKLNDDIFDRILKEEHGQNLK